MVVVFVIVLLIMLVVGEYIDEIDGLFCVGRDWIEKELCDDYMYKREVVDMCEYWFFFYLRRSEYFKFFNRVWVCLGEREVVMRCNDIRVVYISFIE